MLASIDKDGNFTSVFKKQLVEIDDKIRNLFPNIERFVNTKPSAKEWDDWVNKLDGADDSLKDFLKTKDEAYQTKDLATYTQYLKDQNKLIDIQTIKTKALNVVKKIGLNLAIAVASAIVTKGIEFVIKGIDDLIQKSDRLIEKGEEAATKIKEIADKTKSMNDVVSDSGKRFAELSQGVDSLTGKNLSLSDDDYKEFLNISNELLNTFPNLSHVYDENGNAIVTLKGNVDEITKSLNNLLEVQRQLARDEIKDNMPDVLNGNKEIYNKAKKKLDSLTPEYELDKQRIKALQSYMDYYEGFLNGSNSWNQDIDGALRQSYATAFADFNKSKGNKYTNLNAVFGTEDEKEFKKYLDKSINDMLSNYIADTDKLAAEIAVQNDKLKTAFNGYTSSLMATLVDKENYKGLSGEFQTLVNTLLNDIDFEQVALDRDTTIGNLTDDDVSAWIENKFLVPLSKLDPQEKAKASALLAKVFNAKQSGDITALDFAKELQSKLNEYEIDIDVMPIVSDEQGLKDRLYQSIYDIIPFIDNGNTKQLLLDYTENFNKTEIELWLEVTKYAKDAEDAIRLYEQAKQNIKNSQKMDFRDVSDTVAQLDTQLKPAFSSLKSAYQDIFTLDNNGKEVFSLDNVDIDTFASIKSAIEAFNELEGTIDITEERYEEFAKVLVDPKSEANDVHKVFNQLATDFINNSNAIYVDAEAMGVLKQSLEQMGVTNTDEVLGKIAEAQREITDAGYDLKDITLEDVKSFIDLAYASDTAKSYLINYMLTKELANNPLTTTADIQALSDLCQSLGIAIDELRAFGQAKYLASMIDNVSIPDAEKAKMRAQLAGLSQDIKDEIGEKYSVDWELKYSGNVDELSKAAGSSAKEAVDMLEKELAVLDRAMEAGYLDFNDYINRRLGLIEDYYNKGKISADQYYSYLQKHYETELSYMDKVTNAVIRRLDKEKESLEKQKESINERYQKEIDALEKRKSILQEEADNLQRQRDLEKALYDLRRAEEQRTQKIYTADKGFNYVADPNAIRDAQDDVATKKLQIEIAEIDKAIKKLEEARDKEVEAIDQRIEKIEEYKEKWQQISEEFMQKQEDMIAAMVLGADWENDILNQRLDTLENFKDRYIALQQAIVDAAYQAAKAEKDASAGKGGGTSKKEETPNDPIKYDTSKSEPKYVVLYKNPNSGQVSTISKFDKMEDAEKRAAELNRNNLEDIYIVRNPKDNSEKVFTNKQEAQKYAELSGLKMYPSKRRKPDSYYVQKYHTGLDQGYVSKYRPISDDEKLKMFQKFSRSDLRPDEVPALLKAGELVMTKKQQENILKNLQMTYALNSVPANNNQVVNHVTINCPNVTNNSGAEYLMKELNRLTLDALQYANKRY